MSHPVVPTAGKLVGCDIVCHTQETRGKKPGACRAIGRARPVCCPRESQGVAEHARARSSPNAVLAGVVESQPNQC